MKKEEKLRIWREIEITYLDDKGIVHKETLKKFFSLRPYYFYLKFNPKFCYTFIAYTPIFDGEGDDVRPKNFAYGIITKLTKKIILPVVRYGLKHDFDENIK